jgi:hypothetical protein
MPSSATAERQTNAQPGIPVPAASSSSAGGGADQQQTAPQATDATAQGAVEAALKAAELLASGNSAHAVNLQFSVGDADLSLRVELKNGELQATFATDSAQLRSDLAHEWQSTTAANSQSSLHATQPLFTTQSGGSLSFGDSAQQQGRGDASRSESSFAGSGQPASNDYAPSAPDDAQLVSAAHASSLHLQTFA